MPARSQAEVSVADPPLRRPISASPLYLAILCGDLPACTWAAGAVVGGRCQRPTGGWSVSLVGAPLGGVHVLRSTVLGSRRSAWFPRLGAPELVVVIG